MINPTKKFITPEEYLALEEKADHKSEYYNGEIFAMSGASNNHNLITGNVHAALHQLLAKRPCRTYVSDMRLLTSPKGLYTYPDVMVVCGKIEFAPNRNDTVMNPSVLVEVLSDSTQAYDRGEKFALYRKIVTLQEYIMIDQNKPSVEHYRREGHFWVLEALETMDAILTLPSIGCEIPLAVMYEKVEWETDQANSDVNLNQ
ncbi:MAG: Uma2 family endonuclease [Chloroflexi bacterium]|nr:Uma2 family endonuclease [Chloroflexota bacterium]